MGDLGGSVFQLLFKIGYFLMGGTELLKGSCPASVQCQDIFLCLYYSGFKISVVFIFENMVYIDKT